MKRKLVFLFCGLALVASACWEGIHPNYWNLFYIAGVNNFQRHYTEGVGGEGQYAETPEVALPLTVYVKADIQGARTNFPGLKIDIAELRYSISRNGEQVVPMTKVITYIIDDVDVRNYVTKNGAAPRLVTVRNWDIGSDKPRAIFGDGIEVPEAEQGDLITIYCYFVAGTFETGEYESDIEQAEGNRGWAPGCVFTVRYNGKRMIGF